MTDPDFSDPQHRLENISKMEFFRAYAYLRQIAHEGAWEDAPISDLRIIFRYLDTQLACRFGFTNTALIMKLVEVADQVIPYTAAYDEAKAPELGE